MNENNRTLSEQSPLINDVYISSIKKEKNPKMIFVVGGGFTGIGKGTISSSILHILQLNGREDIAYLKLDPFLSTNIALRNIYLDSELFIDSAGQKYDVDYGTVYRFTGIECKKESNITQGAIDRIRLEKENGIREGPLQLHHNSELLINEIVSFIGKSDAKIFVIELGGSVHDDENPRFLNTIGRFRYLFGEENTFYLLMPYAVYLNDVGEMKSRNVQDTMRLFRQNAHIQPDLICIRSPKLLPEKLFHSICNKCHLDPNRVINIPDVSNVYVIPGLLEKEIRALERKTCLINNDYILSTELMERDEHHKEDRLSDLLSSSMNIKLEQRTTDRHFNEMGLRLDKLIQQMHNFDDIHIALCTKKGVRDAFLSLYESIKHCMARINKKVEIYNIDLDHLKIKDIRSVLANIHGTIVIGDYWDEIENNENNIEYEFIKYIVKKDIFYLGIGLGHRLLLEHFFTSSNRKKVPLGSQEIFNYNIEEKFIFKNDFLYGTNSEFELPTFDFDSFKNSNSMRFGYSMVSENEIIPNIIKHQNQFGIINRIEMSSRLLNPSQIIHNFLESVHDLVKTMPHYVVYVAGCILDQSKRAWESEERRASVRRGAIQEVIQPLIDLHIDFPGMPCPEDIKFGNPRKLRVRRDYNNKEYRNHCNSLATRVMDEIKKRVNRKKKPGETVLAIIGMENSPSCAVDSCPDIIDGKKENVKEKGIFIEELSKLLEHNNIDIPILGTYSNPSIGETKKRTRKDIHEFLVNCIVDKRK